jgi:hypothetical protein
MPRINSRSPRRKGFADIISKPSFQGFAALAGLIAAIASDNLIIRIPALVVLFGFLYVLRLTIWHYIKSLLTWLTWKFVLGILVGILIGGIAYPFFESIFKFGFSSVVPQVEILDTYPVDGGRLQNLYDSIEINFSESIPSGYRSPLYVNVEVTPNIPIKRVWVYDYDPTDCCRTLYIESARYFPNSPNPLFESSTTYHLKISGLLIKNPMDIEFHTVPK